jgi:hypothetical protein
MISEAKESFDIHVTFWFVDPGWKRTSNFSVAIEWFLLAMGTTVCS